MNYPKWFSRILTHSFHLTLTAAALFHYIGINEPSLHQIFGCLLDQQHEKPKIPSDSLNGNTVIPMMNHPSLISCPSDRTELKFMVIQNKYFVYGPFGVRMTSGVGFFHSWVLDPMFWLWRRQYYFFIDLPPLGHHSTLTSYFIPNDDVLTKLSVSQLQLIVGT